MPAILTALRCALCDLARPRVLLWMVAPLAGALLVWGVAAALWWEPLTAVVAGWLPSWFPGHWSGRWEAGIRSFFAALLTAGLLAPLVMATALCVTAFFVMPVLVEVVAASRYPQLARRGGGTLAGSVANTLFALARFAVLWLVTLPLWLTGIGALLAPACNAALLNQRVFRYDALAEHASAEEYALLAKTARGRLVGLALALAPLSLIPFANLFAPVYCGLAFTHLCLAELAALRAADPAVSAGAAAEKA